MLDTLGVLAFLIIVGAGLYGYATEWRWLLMKLDRLFERFTIGG